MSDAAARLLRSPSIFMAKALRRSRRMLRAAIGGRRARPTENPPLVLMYHRVADVDSDPWGIAVSPRNFREHLRVLAHEGTCVAVDEIVQEAAAGRYPAGRVCITFDDGYRDNLVHAVAILDELSLPATFFLTSGYMDGTRPFWWDALEHPFFRDVPIPERLELQTEAAPLAFEFAGDTHYREAVFTAHRNWRAGDPPLSKRHEAFVELWQVLQAVPPATRDRLLDEIWNWAPPADRAPAPLGRPMKAEEVRQLASAPGIEIGGHTVSHPALATLDRDTQRREILENKRRLEALAGRPLRYFSYPHGSHTDDTVSILREAGYEAAFINLSFTFAPSPDLFRLPRVTVEDWSGDEFARRLRYGFADD